MEGIIIIVLSNYAISMHVGAATISCYNGWIFIGVAVQVLVTNALREQNLVVHYLFELSRVFH